MAHHHNHYLDRAMSDLGAAPFGVRQNGRIAMAEDDEVADVDEPPEQHVHFAYIDHKSELKRPLSNRHSRSHSLLTQGLVCPDVGEAALFDSTMRRAQSTASNDSNFSALSTAELTSDGGMTSPARTSTPSPPLPSTLGTGLALVPTKTLDSTVEDHHHRLFKDRTSDHIITLQTPAPQAPRKRCITFACSNPKKEQKQTEAVPEQPQVEPIKRTTSLKFFCPTRQPEITAKKTTVEPLKRTTSLKFACPAKPSRNCDDKDTTRQRRLSPAPMRMLQRRHRDSESTIKDETIAKAAKEESKVSKKTNPEGLRFHEFAASRPQEDAWLSAVPTSRQKLTVTDCLRKENAIRKIGEEAEEEALQEEDEENDDDLEDELAGSEGDEDEDEFASESEEDEDDGNETDDEEGFADSDDESDAGSDFQFWTPATATAATSVDHLEHIRPRQHRTLSESSIDSQSEGRGVPIDAYNHASKRGRSRRLRSPRMRPGTPELPDSTDFVCGTFDEDQPLEAAYQSCMEQRRIARLGVIPQDVDPSFPTSDPEQDEDEDEDEVDDFDEGNESNVWVAGRPDESDGTPHRGRTGAGYRSKSPMPSPPPSKRFNKSPLPARRAKSPAPHQMTKSRGIPIHSPAPRRLFGRSPAPMLSPSRHLPSPPSSRLNSPNSDIGNDAAPYHLAQRPNLTHTKSLPRTPNPFWQEHRRRRLAALRDEHSEENGGTGVPDAPTRGPIDIVQGLEHKRQRRKEKFWRQHCRQAAKERPRRPQPGKGAERMRELGLEVADRTKGYGQRLQLVLSV